MLATAPASRPLPPPGARYYAPRGAAKALMLCKDKEVVLSGPANTGKSRACLEKLYLCAAKYAGMRGLIVRKTRESLTQSAMVTFEQKVLPFPSPVRFHTTDNEYRFPNGSVLVVGGLDKPSKLLSSEYDIAYVQEAIELTEDDWETLTTRLRNGVMPYQQIIADTNPGHPTHWLKSRADRGDTLMLESRHEDNPTVTPEYLATLDKLTGVRLLRFRKGLWAAAEGMVYEEWDPALHVIDRFEIPKEWARYRVIDFGYRNPFTCQWWAEDGDGALYRYRELYVTGRLVSDLARQINDLSAGERYVATLADHDAEDRATLHAGGVYTQPAPKEVMPGLEAVQGRLRKGDNGKARIYFLRDSLVARDPVLVEARKPTCTEEEPEGYVWEKGIDGRPAKEQPHKEDDHGLDCTRYLCKYLASSSQGVYL